MKWQLVLEFIYPPAPVQQYLKAKLTQILHIQSTASEEFGTEEGNVTGVHFIAQVSKIITIKATTETGLFLKIREPNSILLLSTLTLAVGMNVIRVTRGDAEGEYYKVLIRDNDTDELLYETSEKYYFGHHTSG